MPEVYYARVCWNSNDWMYPSGDARYLERKSYVQKEGFGHEEWLFNFNRLRDHHHDAFLQPVNNARQAHAGKMLDILLWSIDPNGARVHIGRIRKCEVLTQKQSEEAFDFYTKMGWVKLMKQEVEGTGVKTNQLSRDSLFNVRFLPRDCEVYTPFPVGPSEDPICRIKRYNLVKAEANVLSKWSTAKRKGASEVFAKGLRFRSGSGGGYVDQDHTALQIELLSALKKEYGAHNVEAERDWVDITVLTPRLLIEIKPYSNAKLAIRDGLGQILEYDYFSGQAGKAKLFIVARASLSAEVNKYLTSLRTRFK